MSSPDPEEQRAASRDAWEAAAGPWGQLADRVREWGMPVSQAMLARLDLRAGERVLELAAGPGDTGLMAADMIRPGTLISSDGAAAMVEVARERARAAGITNIEFRQIELEWIDLPTASVDAVLCRWGLMLTIDPEAAAREIRRILVTGGRTAIAVWDKPADNPWATVPSRVMIDLGHAEPPDPQAPGLFALAGDGRLSEVLHDAGFTDVEVTPIAIERRYLTVHDFLAETLELSPIFRSAYRRLNPDQQAEIATRIAIGAAPFTSANGSVSLPGRSLVARAIA